MCLQKGLLPIQVLKEPLTSSPLQQLVLKLRAMVVNSAVIRCMVAALVIALRRPYTDIPITLDILADSPHEC